MTPTPNAGSELPSTLGGPGWRGRVQPHAAELGTVWAACGARSSVTTLREVVLGVPGTEMDFPEDPAAWLMDARPDLPTMLGELAGLVAAYEAAGVRVHLHRPRRPKPNHIFCCDLFFMTGEGAILARMATEQRAGEDREMAHFLAELGVPILLSPRGGATFEGADALWLDARTVLLGLGRRSNREGVEQVSALLRSMGVEVRVAELSPRVQHLLGAFDPVDDHEAFVLREAMTPSLREALAGWRLHELDDDAETVDRRAMNFVCLGPRRLLMPAGNPRTRARFEALGVEVHEAPVSQALRAAGGIGCLSGVLRREG